MVEKNPAGSLQRRCMLRQVPRASIAAANTIYAFAPVLERCRRRGFHARRAGRGRPRDANARARNADERERLSTADVPGLTSLVRSLRKRESFIFLQAKRASLVKT
jgi:hypothetical protein